MTESELGWHFWYFWHKSLFRTSKRSLVGVLKSLSSWKSFKYLHETWSKHPGWGSQQMIGWSCWLINKGICQQMAAVQVIWGSPIKTRDRFNCKCRHSKSKFTLSPNLATVIPTQSLQLLYMRCDSGLDANTFVNRLRDTRPDWVVNKRGLMPCAGARRRDGT